jgi:hypothetical protein
MTNSKTQIGFGEKEESAETLTRRDLPPVMIEYLGANQIWANAQQH